MGDWLKGLVGVRDINDPVATCPLAQGIVNVEVIGHRAGAAGPTRALANVTATVTGPVNPPAAATRADGRKGFGPFPVAGGGYTATIALPANVADRYDIANIGPGAAQTQNLTPGVATVYSFQVPWHWIEFHVRDSQNRPASNVPYRLRHQPPVGGAWTLVETAKTPANGNVVKDETPAGRYRLSVPMLSNPTWTNPVVRTGTLETLTVAASGVEAGDAGEFQIVDAFDDKKVIHTIPAQVSQAGANLQMRVQWTPAPAHLGALTQSRIRFKAKCGGAEALSDARMLAAMEILYVETPAGAPLVTQVTVHFSGGTSWNGNSTNGQAFAVVPWKERIVRVDLPALQRWRITARDDGQPDHVFSKP